MNDGGTFTVRYPEWWVAKSMTDIANGIGLLRTRTEGGQRVTNVEVFFDLVYVFAVTQLAHLLISHLRATGNRQGRGGSGVERTGRVPTIIEYSLP